MSAPQPSLSPLRHVRLTSLLVFGTWMLVGPLWRQVLGHRPDFWFPKWTMFTSYGKDVCKVEYHAGAGLKSPKIDVFEVLGYEQPWDMPRNYWRLKSQNSVNQLGRRLCRTMGPGAEVRANVWCGHSTGWKRKDKATVNLCAAVRAPGPQEKRP